MESKKGIKKPLYYQ